MTRQLTPFSNLIKVCCNNHLCWFIINILIVVDEVVDAEPKGNFRFQSASSNGAQEEIGTQMSEAEITTTNLAFSVAIILSAIGILLLAGVVTNIATTTHHNQDLESQHQVTHQTPINQSCELLYLHVTNEEEEE